MTLTQDPTEELSNLEFCSCLSKFLTVQTAMFDYLIFLSAKLLTLFHHFEPGTSF